MSTVTELALAAKADAAQMEALWLSVSKLIVSWAKPYLRLGESRLYDMDDLTQAGYIALYDAVTGFAPERGAFTTLLRYHCRRRFAETAKGGRGEKRRPELSAVSLNIPLDGEAETTRLDLLADPAAEFEDGVIAREAARQDAAAMLREIDKLPELKRRAVLSTAWEGRSLTEVAVAEGVTVETIRQAKESGLRMVRRSKAARLIWDDYCYRHVSLSRFNRTHTSAVEEAVLWMERVRGRIDEAID